DIIDPTAHGGAEDDEIERGRQHRRQDRAEHGSEEPRQLVAEDRDRAAKVQRAHAGTSPRSTRSTKMSSRLDSRVSISSKAMPSRTSVLMSSAASRLPFPLPSPPR